MAVRCTQWLSGVRLSGVRLSGVHHGCQVYTMAVRCIEDTVYIYDPNAEVKGDLWINIIYVYIYTVHTQAKDEGVY